MFNNNFINCIEWFSKRYITFIYPDQYSCFGNKDFYAAGEKAVGVTEMCIRVAITRAMLSVYDFVGFFPEVPANFYLRHRGIIDRLMQDESFKTKLNVKFTIVEALVKGHYPTIQFRSLCIWPVVFYLMNYYIQSHVVLCYCPFTTGTNKKTTERLGIFRWSRPNPDVTECVRDGRLLRKVPDEHYLPGWNISHDYLPENADKVYKIFNFQEFIINILLGKTPPPGTSYLSNYYLDEMKGSPEARAYSDWLKSFCESEETMAMMCTHREKIPFDTQICELDAALNENMAVSLRCHQVCVAVKNKTIQSGYQTLFAEKNPGPSLDAKCWPASKDFREFNYCIFMIHFPSFHTPIDFSLCELLTQTPSQKTYNNQKYMHVSKFGSSAYFQLAESFGRSQIPDFPELTCIG